jgi:hypothetical protein
MSRASFIQQSYNGILPIAKSNFLEDRSISLLDWVLVGHGESYSDCGKTLVRGCLNRDHHPNTLDGFEGGGVVVELYKRSCMRRECPTCYESWAGKEAGKVEYRLKEFKTKNFRKPIHLSVSIPIKDYNLPFIDVRKLAYKLLRKAGLFGGCSVFHPFRRYCLECGHKPINSHLKICPNCKNNRFGWYFSPHFHILGYGWIRGTKEIYEATEWVIKNLGIRKSLFGTIHYQLSHVGFNPKYHSVTWFGALSYAKLKVRPYKPEKHLCPICKAEFVKLDFDIFGGLDPPTRKEGFYYIVNGKCYDFDS